MNESSETFWSWIWSRCVEFLQVVQTIEKNPEQYVHLKQLKELREFLVDILGDVDKEIALQNKYMGEANERQSDQSGNSKSTTGL